MALGRLVDDVVKGVKPLETPVTEPVAGPGHRAEVGVGAQVAATPSGGGERAQATAAAPLASPVSAAPLADEAALNVSGIPELDRLIKDNIAQAPGPVGLPPRHPEVAGFDARASAESPAGGGNGAQAGATVPDASPAAARAALMEPEPEPEPAAPSPDGAGAGAHPPGGKGPPGPPRPPGSSGIGDDIPHHEQLDALYGKVHEVDGFGVLTHGIKVRDGFAAEEAVKAILYKETGLVMRSLQNNSQHGADGICIDHKRGVVWVLEVKSSVGGVDKANEAQGRPDVKLWEWLHRADFDYRHWKHQYKENAEIVLEAKTMLNRGYRIEGIQVQVGVTTVPKPFGVSANEGIPATEGVPANEGTPASEGVSATEGIPGAEGVLTPAEVLKQEKMQLRFKQWK
jgi:hypothetical protein